MISRISGVNESYPKLSFRGKFDEKHTNPQTTQNESEQKITNIPQETYQAYLWGNKSPGLADSLQYLNRQMTTCRDLSKGREGEIVGSRICASELINQFADEIPQVDDAIKTNVRVDSDGKNVTEARTQIKKMNEGMLYEMAVRQPHPIDEVADKSKPLAQKIKIVQAPFTKEKLYVLNTKGKLMTVAEDGNNVILTNSGNYEKTDNTPLNYLKVSVEQKDNHFKPFEPAIQKVEDRVPTESIGEGTEMIIGMEEGRFVPEIIDSVKTFEEKVNNGEIVLKQFVASPDAKNVQLAMLAGGFGSRAEYTNASSDGIFHSKPDGAQSTKGVFRTATGLTPMETTFVSLHNAGLLDCSQGKLKIGDNIKFYLNRSGINKGNGGFTVDLYDSTDREGRKSLMLFPNDSMSRMSDAAKRSVSIMNSGNAAVVMIAKEVSSEDAKGNFGIMKLGKDNEILEFAEKPKVIPDGYERNGNCLTNTFQFAVSKEAFEALEKVGQYFPAGKGKEPRDWSKTFIPVLMSLTQKDDITEITKDIEKVSDAKEGTIPESVVKEAKDILGNQKIIAVPTDEPWADCGTLNALYHTTMQIANNDFQLEDFERKHVLDSINTHTGLVASTPEQKAEIEDKYDIDGEIMVVPKAQKVNPDIVEEYIDNGLITVHK